LLTIPSIVLHPNGVDLGTRVGFVVDGDGPLARHVRFRPFVDEKEKSRLIGDDERRAAVLQPDVHHRVADLGGPSRRYVNQ